MYVSWGKMFFLSENLVCFVFFLLPCWYSPFCVITDELMFSSIQLYLDIDFLTCFAVPWRWCTSYLSWSSMFWIICIRFKLIQHLWQNADFGLRYLLFVWTVFIISISNCSKDFISVVTYICVTTCVFFLVSVMVIH